MAVNRRLTDEQIEDAARPGEKRGQVIHRLRDKGEQGKGTVIRRVAQPGDPSQAVIPFWPDSVRAIPNDVARSALFTVKSFRTPRQAYRDTPVFSVSANVRLTFTGVELRAADDELVWQQLLHYARNFGPENWIEFTASQLCRDLGWPQNATYRQKVRQSILTLHAASILVERTEPGSQRGMPFRFVDKFEFETIEGEALPRWRVSLGRQLVLWFGGYQFTRLELRGYRQLDPIARRIADYVCSHAAPYAVKIDTLRDMCGSESAVLNRWRHQVKGALAQLQQHGFIESFSIDANDLVTMVRPDQNS